MNSKTILAGRVYTHKAPHDAHSNLFLFSSLQPNLYSNRYENKSALTFEALARCARHCCPSLKNGKSNTLRQERSDAVAGLVCVLPLARPHFSLIYSVWVVIRWSSRTMPWNYYFAWIFIANVDLFRLPFVFAVRRSSLAKGGKNGEIAFSIHALCFVAFFLVRFLMLQRVNCSYWFVCFMSRKKWRTQIE